MLRNIEGKLKTIRNSLMQRELTHLDMQLSQLRGQLNEMVEDFEELKNEHFLSATDFKNVLSLEEFMHSTIYPQLTIYEDDVRQLTGVGTGAPSPVCLTIVTQESSGPITKDKVLGAITLRILTSSLITQIQSGPVQLEIVQATQRNKKGNQDMETNKQNFRENGTAVFF